jgi:hypothetical protein
MKNFLIALSLAAFAFALPGCDDGSVKTSKTLKATSANTSLPPNPALNKVLLLGQTAWGGMTFVSGYLAPYGFAQIGSVDNQVAPTPTLAELQAYDVVLVWTDGAPVNPTALGDNLAAFVDGGGGVVLSSFTQIAGSVALGGAITTGYSPYAFGGATSFSMQALGTVYDFSHYITQGVATLGAFYRSTATLASGGVKIADFANGEPMVAIHATKKVAALAFYPPINTTDMTGDYARLIANALAWVGKR